MQVERKICFPKGRKLKIMQVSDPQDMHFIRYAMTDMLDKAYDTLKPDIVVLTGDNVHGNHMNEYRALFGIFKTEKKEVIAKHIEQAISFIAQPLEKRKIPFCMIYGNHDDLNPLSKQEQADFYKKYSYFFGLNSDEPQLDCDTYNVPIYDENGEKVIFNLWMLDSAGKDDGTGHSYCYVTRETVEWYKKKSDELKKENNGEPVPSFMFQHVPVAEVNSLFTECDENDPDIIKWRGRDNKCLKLDKTKADGVAWEYGSCCEKDVGQLEAVREQGDVCALVFGHDHANSFTADIDGVKIIQTQGASFRSYGTPDLRGIRMFTVDPENPWDFETQTYTYFDLCGKTLKTKIDYMMCADEFDVKRNVFFGVAGITAAVCAGTFGLLKHLKK